MASTPPLPRSDRPDGRSVDATARIWHQVAASRSQHLSRSTACLTTLHEPCGRAAYVQARQQLSCAGAVAVARRRYCRPGLVPAAQRTRMAERTQIQGDDE